MTADCYEALDHNLFKYEWNKPLTKQYELVLSNWCRLGQVGNDAIDLKDIHKLIMGYSQYAQQFQIASLRTSLEINADTVGDNANKPSTFRACSPFPLNKGKYSFTATIEAINDDEFTDGEVLEGLNFIGICSDKYTEFDKYIIWSHKTGIYGFGDDNKQRGLYTWRYFGDGTLPQHWGQCKGSFGHKDRITVEIDMDKGWITGYKNGKRFVENDTGDIPIKMDDRTKFYPVVSIADISKVNVTISYG